MEQVRVASSLEPLLDLIRNAPESLRPPDYDEHHADQMSAQLPVVRGFAEQFADLDIPCTFRPQGALRYTFFAELKRTSIIRSVGDLDGEAKVLAHIRRFIRKGNPETLGAGLVPGSSGNRQQRRQRGTSQQQPFTVEVSHPAAVATVIGIYL